MSLTNELLIALVIIGIVTMTCSIITAVINIKASKDKKLPQTIIMIVGIVLVVAISMLVVIGLTAKEDKFVDYKKTSTTSVQEPESTENTEDELSAAGFKELSLDDYLKLIKSDKKSIILIARPTCSFCQMFTPVLKQAKEEMKLEVNYFNTDTIADEDTANKFYSSLDYLKTDEWGTPLTLIVKDGKIIDKNNGYVELKEIKEFFKKNGFGE